MIQQTSLMAFETVDKEGQQQLVLECLKRLGNATELEITDALFMFSVLRTSITARIKELKDSGEIIIVGKKENRTGRSAELLTINITN